LSLASVELSRDVGRSEHAFNERVTFTRRRNNQ